MSRKIIVGAAAAFVLGVGGYLACDVDEPIEGDGTSELLVVIRPQAEFPLRDNPSTQPSTVLVVIGGLHAHHVEDGWVDLHTTGTFDLLAPQDRIPGLLSTAGLPEGMFDQLRFDVVYSAVEVDRRWYPLEIPSEDQSGLKVHTGFCLVDGETSSLELDWDVDESLHYSDQRGYWLTPSLETFSPPTCADDLRTPPRS